MKKVIVGIIVIILSSMGFSEWTTELGVHSRYIWRGQDWGGIAFQPSITFTDDNTGLGANLFGSIHGRVDDTYPSNEIDYSIFYGFSCFDVEMTATVAQNMNETNLPFASNYSHWYTTEISLEGSKKLGEDLSICFLIAREVPRLSYSVDDRSLYLEAGADYNLQGIGIAPRIGFGDQRYNTNKDETINEGIALVNASLELSKSLTETITGKITNSYNPVIKENYLFASLLYNL